MSTAEFDKIADLTFRSDNKRSRKAVRLVIEGGMSQVGAAKVAGVTEATVSSAVRRFRKTAEIIGR